MGLSIISKQGKSGSTGGEGTGMDGSFSPDIVNDVSTHLDALCDILRNANVDGSETDKHIKVLQEQYGEGVFPFKVYLASQKGLLLCLGSGEISKTEDFIKFIEDKIGYAKKDLFTKNILESLQNQLFEFISHGWINEAREFVQFLEENFTDLNMQDLFTEKILQGSRKTLSYFLENCNLSDANYLIQFLEDNFEFNRQDLFTEGTLYASQKYLSTCLRYHNLTDNGKELIRFLEEKFNFNKQDLFSEDVLHSLQKGFVRCLSAAWVDSAQDRIQFVKDNFEFNEQDFFTKDILEALRNGISKCIEKGDLQGAKALSKILQF